MPLPEGYEDAVEISPQRVACPGHGEHLREQWPRGFAVFAITMFQVATESPRLWAACREAAGLPRDANDLGPQLINLVTEKRPLCYFVPRAKIASILRDTELFAIGVCQVCERSGFVAPYSMRMPRGVERLERLCVECACNTGERIHRAHPKGGVWHG